MAKREILRAAKRKGVRIEELYYEWEATPEEMVPCWSVTFNEEDMDRYGESSFQQFDNTAHAVTWIGDLPEEPRHD